MWSAGWVRLVLAFSLYATVTASSEPTVQECVWTQRVTGRVVIKDKSAKNTLGTIKEDELCPTEVKFSKCTACVDNQSNLTISCQIIGNDRPEFMVEFGKSMRGDMHRPDFNDCKTKVIEKEEETEIHSDRPSKTQSERQRLWLLSPFLAFLLPSSLLLIYWFRKKPHNYEETPQELSTNANTNGRFDGDGNLNGPCHSTVPPNGPCHLTVPPNGPCHSTVPPNGPCHSTVPPNGPCHSTVPPNGPCHSTVPPNGPCHLTVPPNGPCHLTVPPNGPCHLTVPPNGPCHLTVPPNGPCHLTVPPNGPCHSTVPPNGPCHSTVPPNGPCHSTVPPNGPCHSTVPPNGPCHSTVPPNGPCHSTVPPNGPCHTLAV